ncbi:hypothetical protein [Streptomyces sp. NPDC006285]|uniref:hypothetical protein n=1 Tax=Streptomyces sp. NPDC006285 TaxID=3364742 RepID=UPI003691EEFB
MSDTVQLIGTAGGCAVLMLALVTRAGAALGRYEADLQHAAYTARLERKREAARERARPSWPDVYPPLLPTTVPTRQLPHAPTPLTTAQPGPPGSGRRRKGKTSC